MSRSILRNEMMERLSGGEKGREGAVGRVYFQNEIHPRIGD